MQDFQKSMVSVEKGKEILKETREMVYKIPQKYPFLLSYIGEGMSMRQDLLGILAYLLNPHNKLNEAGEIEQRFFTAYHQYCFYLDTNAIVDKVYGNRKSGRKRANHSINFLCALGFFQKDKKPERYYVNQDMAMNTNNRRFMTIYHFKHIKLSEIEDRARRLRESKITMSTISKDRLQAAGMSDIAEEVYFQNDRDVYPRKQRNNNEIMKAMEQLIQEKGYCTREDIFSAVRYGEKYTEDLLKTFRTEIEKLYYYGPATRKDKRNYGYTGRKWIYTKKEKKN